MAFEKYTISAYCGRYNEANLIPRISILKGGLASFSNRVVIDYIKTCSFVLLYFDKETNRIGFEFTDKEEQGVRKITSNRRRCSCSIKNFLNYHKIDYSVSKKYDVTFDEENKLYVIQL